MWMIYRSFWASTCDCILLAVRIGLGCVLLYSTLPKLMHPYDPLSDVYYYETLGPNMGLLAATVLPAVQLAIGVCLITGLFLPGAALGSISLFGAFSVALASVLWRGLNINCGCFGSAELVTYFTLFRALFLSLLSFVLFIRLLALGAKRSILRICI